MGVVFSHTVRAFIHRVFRARELLTPATRAHFAALGIDADAPKDVPPERWWKLVQYAAELQNAESLDLALLELGRDMVRGYQDGVIGTALFLAMRLMGVKRALIRMADHFRTADSITRVETVDEGERQVSVLMTAEGGLPFPTYTQGVLLEGLDRVGAKDPVVSWSRVGEGVRFRLSWG